MCRLYKFLLQYRYQNWLWFWAYTKVKEERQICEKNECRFYSAFAMTLKVIFSLLMEICFKTITSVRCPKMRRDAGVKCCLFMVKRQHFTPASLFIFGRRTDVMALVNREICFNLKLVRLWKIHFSDTDRLSLVKSLGGHFAYLCCGFDFYEVKQNIVIFQKEKGNTFTLLIIFIVKVYSQHLNPYLVYHCDTL